MPPLLCFAAAALIKPEAFLPSSFVTVGSTSPLVAMMSQWPGAANALLGMGPEAAALIAQQQHLQQQHLQHQQLQLQQQQLLQQQHLQHAWARPLNTATLAAVVAGGMPMGKGRLFGEDPNKKGLVPPDMPVLTACKVDPGLLHKVILVWAFIHVFREVLDLPSWSWNEFEADMCDDKHSNYLSVPNLIGLQVTRYMFKHMPAAAHDNVVPCLPINALTWAELLRNLISHLPVAGLQRAADVHAMKDAKTCSVCERKLGSDAFSDAQVRQFLLASIFNTCMYAYNLSMGKNTPFSMRICVCTKPRNMRVQYQPSSYLVSQLKAWMPLY
jgi:hypothetical protein